MAAGLTVKIRGDASHFDKTLKSVKGGLSSIKTPLTAVAAGAAAVGAAIGAAAFGAYKLTESLINVGEAARKEDAVLGNVVKRMGLFGTGADKITAKMIKYADATELATGIDAGIIKSTQAKLSTFEEVAKTAGDVGGAFDRATKAALDMSIVFGGDASQYAVQLGKALQDPEKGLAALKKTGALTRLDIERIGAEFAASGNKAKAFDQILSAIERQVGGASEAAATGTSRIRAAFNQMRDELGVPISEQFDKLADTISKQTPAIVEGFKAMAPQISTAFNTIFTAIGEAMQGNTDRLFAIGTFIGETIVDGAKTSLLAAATSLSDELIALMNPQARLAFQAAKLAGFDIDKASGVAGQQIMRAGASEVATNFQRLMAQNAPPIQGVGGSQFRLAMPGESSPFRDETGRMIILLESIDRKLNPTPFPAR
jgi:hypothetical protein